MKKTRAVFFDRDGVLIETNFIDGTPVPVRKFSDVQIKPWIKDICSHLHKKNVPMFMITNQPDPARGKCSKSFVYKVNNYLKTELKLTKNYTCFHKNDYECNCRKPKPGMVLQAEKNFNLDLQNSFVIGDRWRDIKIAEYVQIKTVFLMNKGYNEELVDSDLIFYETEAMWRWIKNEF